MNTSQKAYINYIESCVRKYRATLEQIFGPPDSRFEFREVNHFDDGPDIYYPNGFQCTGSCRMNIRISTDAGKRQCYDQGAWQVAHECVHLLNPGPRDTTNILEEGLATWFQNTPCYHDQNVQNYIPRAENSISQNYREAQELVCRYGESLRKAVKTLRIEGVRIREIAAKKLGRVLPSSSIADITRLCALFDYQSTAK